MARTEHGRGSRQGRHRIWLPVIFTFFAFPLPSAAQFGGRPEKSNFTISYTQASGAFTPLWDRMIQPRMLSDKLPSRSIRDYLKSGRIFMCGEMDDTLMKEEIALLGDD